MEQVKPLHVRVAEALGWTGTAIELLDAGTEGDGEFYDEVEREKYLSLARTLLRKANGGKE